MSLTKVTYSMIQGAEFNAADFGVVNDGVTDCSTALQTAIITATSQTGVYATDGTEDGNAKAAILVLPPGKYLIGTKVLVPRNIIIHGNNATIIGGASNVVFESGYYSAPGVLASTFDLPSDNAAITNRLFNTQFRNLTFYQCVTAIRLRAFNEQCGVFDCIFNECNRAVEAYQAFYSVYKNNLVRGFLDDGTVPAFKLGRSSNAVTIENCYFDYRLTNGVLLEIGQYTYGCSEVNIINCDFSQTTYSIKLVGNFYNLNITGNRFEETANGITTDDELKYNVNIANNYCYNCNTLVTGSGLRDSFIGNHRDNAFPANKAAIALGNGGYGYKNHVIIETTGFGDATTPAIYSATGNVLYQGMNSLGGVWRNKNAVVGGYVPVYDSGGYGYVPNDLIGASFFASAGGADAYADTNMIAGTQSNYSTFTYAIRVIPDAGSGPGGSTPGIEYLRGVIVGNAGIPLNAVGQSHDVTVSDVGGYLRLTWDGFGISPTDPNYDWLRNGDFTAEGIIKLIA